MKALIFNEQTGSDKQEKYFKDGAKQAVLYISVIDEDEIREVVENYLSDEKDERISKIIIERKNLKDKNFWCRLVLKGRIQDEFKL